VAIYSNNSIEERGIRQDAARATTTPLLLRGQIYMCIVIILQIGLVWANDTVSKESKLITSGVEVMTLNGHIYTIPAGCEV